MKGRVVNRKAGSSCDLDYYLYKEECRCGGVLVDLNIADDDVTHLQCRQCGHTVERINTSYHSDNNDARLVEFYTELAGLGKEKDYNELIAEMHELEWSPVIPTTRRQLWDLQRRISYFKRVAMSYNKYLKGVQSNYLRAKRDRRPRLENRRFISAIEVFDAYCDRIGADGETVKWIISNWEALTLKEELPEQPDWVGRMPVRYNDSGEAVELEYSNETIEFMWDYRKFTPEDIYVEAYVSHNLLRAWNKCLEKIDKANHTTRWLMEDLKSLVLYCKSRRLSHPSVDRYVKSKKFNLKKFWYEVEKAEKAERYESEVF